MSTQTVVDVIVSGSTTTIVDKRIDGITTVAGAAPITEVSGQRPDLGVKTCLLGGEGDILSLTNDVAQLRANLIVTGTTLTDEIGVLSGHLITTGNNLEFQLSTLSGNLIASGNNLDSLRDILSGNLITTGNVLQNLITGATGDISTITQNLISTGNNLQNQILNSGEITDDISGNLIITGQTLTNNLISTGNALQPQIDTIEGDLTTTGQTLLITGANLQTLIVNNANNLIDTGNNLEPRINTNVANISTLNTVTGVLSSATGELQEYKFNKSGGTISGSILPSSSGSFNLGSPSLTFQTGYFDDLEVGSNTLFIGGVPIKSINGGINFFDATGTTAFRDVSIRNLTVTGTETIIDVEHLAVKDNIIIINSGESGAGIGVRSGGLVIDRGTLPDADFLFNENNDRFEIDFPLAVNGNVVVTQNQTGAYADSSNLIQTGVTLQNQITSNDTDITSLETATGELKTQSNATDSNLITTGQTLTSEIAIVSGIAGGSSFDQLSGNLITTGQTLTSEIATVSGLIGQEGSDIDTLSGNLITTGQTLQTQITSNDSDISTLTSNLVITGSRIDSISGSLITTGQTLQAQVNSNDSDIITLTSNLRQTGVNMTNLLIETGFAILDTSGNANTISGNLISTGKYLTDEIATVSGMATGGAAADIISGNLITTGQTLTSEIGIVSGLTVTNTNNLISTGNNLQGQITSNDGQIAGIIGDLVNTGQTLTTNINSVSSNLITTGQTLTSEIAIVSGIATGGSAQDFRELSGNLITTGQTLQTQITSNDGDITNLTSNLITTGQTLTSEIAIVSGLTTGSSSDPDLSGKVDTLSGNLITTGQYLTDEIAVVSGIAGGQDLTALSGTVDTLSGNVITTGQYLTDEIAIVSGLAGGGDINTLSGNLITTGQTLTTNINTVSSNLISTGNVVDDISGNLITTGQTLQAQITSNDGDITTLTSNLITTGQTTINNLITSGNFLDSEIATVSGLTTGSSSDPALSGKVDTLSGNLITTGQTLQTQITSNDSDITTLTSNLITTGSFIDDVSGNLITTGQTLQTQITSNDNDISNITSNLVTTGQTLQTQITSNDSDISTLTSNLVTTGQTLTSEIAIVSGIATGGSEQDFRELSGNLITTGQTLQTQITNNDSDISTLTSNLITTGQTLTTNVNTVSSNLVSTGKVIDDVSGNLITTGQTLQTQITSNDGDITTLTSNLVTTGQTLTTNINTVSTNLVSTGKVIDDVSGNLITTGQTLQTQITSNDGDITTLTSNLVTTGQTLTTNINTVATNLGTSGQTLQTQITSNDSDISTLTSNLGTTGQTLQTQITSNDSDIASLTTNLGTTGQTLQTQITSNDSDISTLDSTTVKLTTNQSIAGNKIFTNDVTINNLTVTGTEVVVDVENLAVKDNIIEINSGESGAGISRISGGIVIDRGTAANANILYNDANDRFELNFPLAVEGEVVASASNLITTGQTLTTNINTVSTNLGTSGQTLQTQITSNDSDISTLTTNLGSTGQTLQTQITSNDSDISTLTSNLVTTGQTLTTNVNTVSNNLVSTGSVVDDISGNLITTGQTLQTQITSNDADVTTLTSNLVTTGQTLTTNINTVSTNLISTGKVVDDISGNLITTGQTLQTQITSNDTDITNLSSNLVTTGQTLTTNINTVATNLVTTGQTLTSEIATVSGLIPATVIDGGGTANTVPLWSDANTIGDSVISQSSSKIGIGIASPTAQLHIKGSDTTDQVVIENTDASSTSAPDLVLYRNSTSPAASDNIGLIQFRGRNDNSQDVNYASILANAVDETDTTEDTKLSFYTYVAGTETESVVIKSGNVGIGTATPASKLHVYGSNAETTIAKIDGSLRMGVLNSYIKGPNDYKLLRFTNAGLVYNEDGAAALDFRMEGDTNTNLFLLDASADSIGIGEAPVSNASLFVGGSKTYPLRVQTTNAQYYFADSVIYANSANGMYILNQSSHLALGANNAELMRLTGGKVGIGTNSPANLLHVYNSSGNGEVKVERASGASILIQAQSAQGKILTTSNDSLQLGTNNTGYLTISTSGATTLIGSLTVGADDTGHDVRLYGATSGRYWEWDESMDLVRMRDNVKTVWGNGDDLQIYHNGSHSYIDGTNTGDLYIRSTSDDVVIQGADDVFIYTQGGEDAIIARGDAGVDLFHDNVKKFETTATGATVSGGLTVNDSDGRSTVTLIGAKTSDGNFADIYGSNNSDAGRAQISFRRDGANDAAAILFYTEATGSSLAEAVRINSAGCVGIGTASPADTLHVYGAGTTAIFQSSSANGYISIKETSGGNHVYLGNQSGEFVIQTPGSSYSTKFQVTSAGLVGIGIAPTSQLHVKATSGTAVIIDGTDDSTSLGSSPGLIIRQGDTNNDFSILKFEASGTGPLAMVGAKALTTGAYPNSVGELHFGVQNGGGTITAMTISGSNSGAVTIGAFTLPTADGSAGQVLQTNGSGTVTWATVSGGGGVSGSGTDHFIPRWNGTTALQNSSIIALDSGSVGIGTATPGSLLEIYENDSNEGNTQLHIHNDKNDDAAVIKLEGKRTSSNDTAQVLFANSGNGIAAIKALTAGADDGLITFSTSAAGSGSTLTEYMRITSAGSVGIGYATPSARLFIIGDSSSRAFQAVGSSTTAGVGYFYTNEIHSGTTTNAVVSIRSDHASSSGQILHVRGDGSGDLLTLDQGGTSRVVVKAAGSVGIGTNAPAQMLSVFQGRIGVTDGYQIGDMTGNTGMIVYGGSRIVWEVGGSEKMRVNSSGSVGIGTATPAVPLHVYTNSASGQEIMLENDGAGEVGLILRTDRGSDGNLLGWLGFDGNDDGGTNTRYATIESYIVDNTNGTEDGAIRFSVMAGGNDRESMTISARSGVSDIGFVGIGSNAPTFPLQVYGANQTNGSAKRIVAFFDTTSAAAGTGAGIALGGYTNGTSGGINDFGVIQGIKENGTAGNYASALTFHTRANGANTVERMRLSSDGKLLINATSPTLNTGSTLYVNGNAYASEFELPSGGKLDWANGDATIEEGLTSNYSLSLRNYDGSSAMVTTMFLKSGGNVGIGTVAPAAHLHVSKAAGTTTVLTEVAAGSTVGYEIKKTGSTTQHWKIVDGQTANGYLEIYDATDSATRMAFNTAGNVGIGTVNAGQLLTIKGDGKFFGAYASDGSLSVRLGVDASGDGQLLLADSNGTTKVLIEAEAGADSYINNGGGLAIGTTSTSQSLQVNGTVSFRPNGSGNEQHYFTTGGANNPSYSMYDSGGTIVNRFRTDSTSYINGGSVGIGTATPTGRLTIKSSGNSSYGLEVQSSLDADKIFGVYQDGDGDGALYLFNKDTTTTVGLSSVGNSWLTGGNFGIGTNAPAMTLDVYKSVTGNWLSRIHNTATSGNSSGLLVRMDEAGSSGFAFATLVNGNYQFAVKPDGNVGIGTAVPLDKLDVYGTGAVFRNLSDNADSVQILRGTNFNASPDAKFYIYDNSSADWAAKINLDGASYGLDITGGVNYFLLCRDASGNRMFEVHNTSVVVNDGSTDMDFRVEGNGDDYLLFTDGGNDRVAISTNTPAAKLHVEGDFKVGASNNGNWMGYKDVAMNGSSYTTALTISLADHTACHVKLFISGDWSGHSAVAFVGEYFIQNSADGYQEPGQIISEFDNTNTDLIMSKIVDPSSDTFTIQLKLSTTANGSFTGKLSYHVMGMATAVS